MDFHSCQDQSLTSIYTGLFSFQNNPIILYSLSMATDCALDEQDNLKNASDIEFFDSKTNTRPISGPAACISSGCLIGTVNSSFFPYSSWLNCLIGHAVCDPSHKVLGLLPFYFFWLLTLSNITILQVSAVGEGRRWQTLLLHRVWARIANLR